MNLLSRPLQLVQKQGDLIQKCPVRGCRKGLQGVKEGFMGVSWI